MHSQEHPPRRFSKIGALLLVISMAIGCSPAAEPSPSSSATTNATSALFDSTTVHEIAITFDQAAYDAMIATYLDSGTKEWIEGTVTIDGQVYEQVGLRLKGNSSLRAMNSAQGGGPSGGLSSDQPEKLPWLVSLDKFVTGQNHDGIVEFVVRSNNTATALNEAVALELLELAGLASQDAASTRLSVNGSAQILRLVIENPDDAWMTASFGGSGALYKAESTGNYSYRGDDPAAYDEVFDQEAGAENADLTPLIEFLQFINESDDATFAAEIATKLDVDAFATYLAMQELLDNFDDIDGPGNNSYLYYDVGSAQFTVVPWITTSPSALVSAAVAARSTRATCRSAACRPVARIPATGRISTTRWRTGRRPGFPRRLEHPVAAFPRHRGQPGAGRPEDRRAEGEAVR